MTTTDQTQVIPSQADTELMAAIPRPRPPAEAYIPPSRAYLARLLARAREASGKAREASERYNALATELEARAALSHPEGSEAQRVAVKFARSGDTLVGDADRQYQFWKGEQHRLCDMIAAEHDMWRMMQGV